MEAVKEKVQLQKYPAYKDSDIEWVEKVPDHWDTKKLKHLFIEKKKTTNPKLNCGSISFGKVVYKDDEKVTEATKSSYQEVLEGDFLINPLNLNYDLISLRIALSKINVVVSSGYIVLQNRIELDKGFFNYLLHIFDVSFMKTLGSGVRQTLSFNHLANSELLYPPKQEQSAIANFLDEKCGKIDTAIAQKQQLIELLKERKQIIIQNAVTKGLDPDVKMKDSGVEWIGEIPEHWDLVPFRRLTFLQQGLQIPIDKRLEEPIEGALEYITTKSIHNPLNPKHFVLKAKDSVICRTNDILLGRTGNTGEVVTGVEGVFHNNFFKIIYNTKKIEKSYLVDYLNTPLIQNQIMLSAGVTTIPDLNHGDFLSIKSILPPMKEQKNITEFISEKSSEIFDAVALQKQQIEKLQEYKSSLIDAAVTGKIKIN